jgi:murein DD-endopeptidase MepM/ murein hydrolase activator NlpD
VTVAAAGAAIFLAAATLASAQPTSDAVRLAVDARALQPGELLLVNMDVGVEADRVQVRAFGRTTPAFKSANAKWQALVGIDLDQPPREYVLTADVHVGSTILSGATTVAVRAKRFGTRTLSVPPEFVDPPAALEKRIASEAAFLRDVYGHPASTRLWELPFIRPVPQPANSRFGTRSVFNGKPRTPHAGADFLSPAGTPVTAPGHGRVVAARDLFFSGNTVVIDHGLGVFSTLAHLSRIDVREGDSVAAGATVGLVGATGRVTGAHLHWAVRVGEARVDPLSVLAILGKTAAAATEAR